MNTSLWLAIAAFAAGIALSALPAAAQRVVWMEAESFADTGRWSNDSQHVDLMGSPYLLATGVGKPVADAVTSANLPAAGTYRLWVRCRDWLPEYSPGRFQVLLGDKASAVTFGKADNDKWQWVDGGAFDLPAGNVEVRIRDLTGWYGRCDAVVLAAGEFRPADDLKQLAAQRIEHLGASATPKPMGPYDLVVVGGGPAGLGAALAAARNGCKVAFVQDRPVLGGNSSSEIEVPPMGYIGNPPDKVNVTGIAEEIFPAQSWSNIADSRMIERIVRAEPNITLMLNTRATGVEMASPDTIKCVLAMDVRTGRRLALSAPLFADCTGHGWIGYYAGAEYRQGQEPRAEFGESLAPVKPGTRTMGDSLYKAVIVERKPAATGDDANASKGSPFVCPPWAYQWTKSSDFEPFGSHRRSKTTDRPENFDAPSRGKGRNPGDNADGAIIHSWWIELGGMQNTIADAESVRDELIRITLGMWNYAKNHNPKTVAKNANRDLVWINYVPGVRESRRLVGDYIMSQRDFDTQTVHGDTVAFTDWGIDVHHPEGFWVQGNDAIHVYQGRRISIPYRTLYSRNISNLFMAGRCHSATHIAMGGTRVMRPMCATGQAAGTAAAVAKAHNTSPRGVYETYIGELQQALLRDGCYLLGAKNADPADLALSAEVAASSFAAGAEPASAVNGWNRVVGKDRNAWAPDPKVDGAAWISFKLRAPAAVGEVHVTAEAQNADFHVEAMVGGAWKPVAKSADNRSRRIVLRFEPVRTDSIRLVADSDKPPLALCEVRIYAAGAGR
jgi:hypothetical protein